MARRGGVPLRKLPFALVLATVATLTAAPALATALFVVPDVPTDLGGTTYLPSHVVRYDTPVYTPTPVLALPPGTTIDALHRMVTGDWLVSVEVATDLGGTTFLPNDVIRTNGVGFAAIFCGSLVGIPVASNVDAVSQDPAGNLRISFDVPTTLTAGTFDPSDIVRFTRIGPNCGDWMAAGLAFDASATAPPVPIASNVTAADVRGALTITSFDVPTTLAASTFLPGHLDSWNGAGFALFEAMAGWPVSSYVHALSFLAAPGTVPVDMTVQRLLVDGSQIRLVWSSSCSADDEDYGIYEGAIGTWYSHTQIDCNDAFSDLMEDVGTTSGNRYYLVVPKNPNDEGSYGRDSSGSQRPAGSPGTCIPTQAIACP